MGLLKPAMNQTAYLKLGMLGFEGSGKTFTAVDFALGITKQLGGKKVAFFDTEKGSDFHIDRFKKAGIGLDVLKSKSFADLCTTIREAEKEGYSFLIIDSITHVWRELCASYLKKKNRPNLTMKDWGTLKAEWAQYTDLYVNSKLHVAMLGRAGHEYDMDEDEDGKKEVIKAGTKMKVETETGFEPDLLLEMFTERVPVKGNKKISTLVNKCLVRKDRTDTLNGRVIERPKFSDFAPIIKFLNLGGEHVGTDASRTSEHMFGSPDRSWAERQKRQEIALERLAEALTLGGLTGTAQETQKKRIQFLIDVFGTSSKTELESMELEKLEAGLAAAREKLSLGKPAVQPNGAAQLDVPNF
jgi:hypothetical protein